jgi:hypothetical protein
MGNLLIPHPWLAMVPAAVLALAGKMARLRSLFVVAALWASYSGYEYLMKVRVLCSGECDIRIDLLAIYPALILGTVAVLAHLIYVVAGATKSRRADPTGRRS